MSVVIGVLNGTNENRDEQFQAICSATMTAGVRKGFKNALEVTTGQVNTGMAFVEVVRTSVTPNETFLIPVSVNAATAVSTAGTGWIIIKISQVKINDGSSNATDGTGVATIENVAVLPADPYLILATLSGGVITDARTYSQVQSNILDNVQDLITLNLNSVNWKEKVRVSTTGNITISTALNAGDVIDGVTLANGDRVGVFLQTDATQNGIYIVGSSPARSPDFDATAEITGARVPVGPEGTANANSNYLCTSTNPVIGVDDIDFVVYGSSTIIATQAEAEAAINDTKMMTPLKAKQSRQFTATAGENVDGSTTPQAVYMQSQEDLIGSITQSSDTGSAIFGYLTINDYKVGQTFTAVGDIFKNAEFYIEKVGAPADSVISKLYSSDKTTLLHTSNNSFAAASISGITTCLFEFPSTRIAIGQTYFLVLERTGNVDTSRYYRVRTGTGYSGGSGFQYDTSWNDLGVDLKFIISNYSLNINYKKAASYFTGFVKGNKTTGQTDQIICNDGEIVDGFTGLIIGADYFVQSVAGTIGLTDNTGNMVGEAVSTTQIMIKKATANHVCIASQALRQSADTPRTVIHNDYKLKKEVTLYLAGTIKVRFRLKAKYIYGSIASIYGRVYINGVAVGTEREQNCAGTAVFEEDFTVASGDIVQLYAKGSISYDTEAYVSDFRIYYDIIGKKNSLVVTD